MTMSTFVNTDPSAFKGVWVFCEQREGKLMPTDFELISKGRDLANELGVNLCGLLLGGEGIESAAKELGGYGADKVLVCESPLLKDYTTDAYAKVLCDMVNEYKPEALLIGATNIGRDLGPRCAARLHTGLCADCTHLDVDMPIYKDFLRSASTLPEEKIEKTPLYGIGYMFAAMMAVNIIIMVVNMMFGKSIEIPDGMDTGNTPAALLEFADAAVWEEVISRLVPIGIPMAIVALANRRRGWPAYILGGFGLSKLAVALILISSLMFGFAHMSGWGILKVAPTFFTGIMMGWLYCRFGIHASIAFHFLVDYLSVISYTGLQIPVSLATLVVMAVGFVALGLIILGLRSIRKDVKALPDWIPDQESIFCRRGSD